MEEFKEFTKITDYIGNRVRIVPTVFTTVQTRFSDMPSDVVYADVTVLNVLDQPEFLGNVVIFQRMLISQIKDAWRGRPIIGTLIRKDDPLGTRLGLVLLEDMEIE